MTTPHPVNAAPASPEAKRPKYTKVWHDEDGYWGLLPQGWSVDGCSGVREDTKAALLARLSEAKPEASR